MPSDKQPQTSKGNSAKWSLGGKGYVPRHHQSRPRPKETATAKQTARSTPNRSRVVEGRDNPPQRATTSNNSSVNPKPVVPATSASNLRFMNMAQKNNVQRQFMQVTGTDSNSREIKYRITEFFDIPAEVKIAAYWWDYQQTLTASGGPSADFNSSGRVWSRPIKAKLYVLPRSDPANNAASSFVLSSGIPLLSTGSAPTDFNLAGTGSKVVKPDFNVKWTHAATFDYDKTFSTAITQPRLNSGGNAMCLFQAAAVDVDTGNNFNSPVQCMLVLDVCQNVPAMCQVSALTTSGDTWGNPTITEDLDSQFALVQPIGTSNRS